MGFRSRTTSMIVSVLIMAIAWEASEAGLVRDLTGTFQGKIVVSIFIVILGTVIGAILSGGN